MAPAHIHRSSGLRRVVRVTTPLIACAFIAVGTAVVAAGTTLSSAATSGTNLLANPSFTTTSAVCPKKFVKLAAGSTAMTGWSVGGNSINVVCTFWTPESGQQSIDLAGTVAPGSGLSASGSIYQTVTTTAGDSYVLSWYLAGNPTCSSPPADTTKTMDVYWNGTLVDSPTFDTTGHSQTSMGWEQQQIDVTATATSTVVKFADATTGPAGSPSNCGAALDLPSVVLSSTSPTTTTTSTSTSTTTTTATTSTTTSTTTTTLANVTSPTGAPSTTTTVPAAVSSSSLAFTGPGEAVKWTALAGAVLILLGMGLLALVDAPRRLLRRLAQLGPRRRGTGS